MSIVNKMLVRGQKSLLLAGHKDCVTILDGVLVGAKLVGVIDSEQSNSPEALLGEDPRMKTVLRLLPPFSLFPVEDGTTVTNGITIWKLIRREDNAATITTDYDMEQQI